MFQIESFRRTSTLDADSSKLCQRPFSRGNRPVIRWIKGDGRDDEVTRSAIAQATRTFGASVDYCLCTAELSPARVRAVLAWAEQPVEWWPLTPLDNAPLSTALMKAGCYPDRFGYWWKWFPERVRLDAPEWILDGDIVITAPPRWFTKWADGHDGTRVTQDDSWDVNDLYGEYLQLVDQERRLYSGLISLPPGLSYISEMFRILDSQPLASGHDGRTNKSEQGVVAAAFEALGAIPIPLSEFPFARAFEEQLNYGRGGPNLSSWGYHFGNAFRMENPHFRRLVEEGRVFWKGGEEAPEERFTWMNNWSQQGTPNRPTELRCMRRIAELARDYSGRPALELGTSRGRLSAVLCACGCLVTTIGKLDRGAFQNLEGLGINVIVDDFPAFLREFDYKFSLVLIDLHEISLQIRKELCALICRALEPDGAFVLYNTSNWKTTDDPKELEWIPEGWTTESSQAGMLICRQS